MVEMMTTDVRAILDRSPFDASALGDLREVLGKDPSRYVTLREAVNALRERHKGNLPGEVALRVGVGEALLGHYRSALAVLEKAEPSGLTFYYKGLSNLNLQRWLDAAEAFELAARAGHDPKSSELNQAGALRRAGKLEEARAILDRLTDTAEGASEYHYQLGSILAADGDLIAASAELEKALALDRDHTGALFELAYINDLHGNDDLAIEYYSRCVKRPPTPLGALINLGILLEDRMHFREAENCYRQVLNHEPNHPRAALFFKDCRASRDMYYDENKEKDNAVKRQLMEIPVTDFELSVRSRNCLRKMNIRTLGDLTRTTEMALLSSKNFGETSLSEIKEMMVSKNLWLGMALEGGAGPVGPSGSVSSPSEDLSPEDKMILARPINELNLSVRARKCMTKLGINTLAELLQRTGDELLECKNFGVTSLNEVREKLTTMNLKLKND